MAATTVRRPRPDGAGSQKRARKRSPTYITKQAAGLVREKKSTVVERELELLYERDGSVTAQGIVAEATDEANPLHKYFEWDDGRAATRYRLVQATQMILATKFVCVLQESDGALPEVVASHPVRKLLPALGDGFKPREEVLNEEGSRLAIIEKKKSALRAWCGSVVDIEELGDFRSAIERLLGPAR